MSVITNVLWIQRESTSGFNLVRFSDYALTERQHAAADIDALAAAEPGRKFRLVIEVNGVVVALLAEVYR